jgi:hypothetical protein
MSASKQLDRFSTKEEREERERERRKQVMETFTKNDCAS